MARTEKGLHDDSTPLLSAEKGSSATDKEVAFQHDGEHYKIAQGRWGVFALVSIIQLVDSYNKGFFAFINDVVSSYFKTSPEMTDFLTTLNWSSRSFLGPIIALTSEHLNIRLLALGSSGLMFVSYLMLLVGISSRENFAIVIIGQILSGLAFPLFILLLQVSVTNWFPKTERGKVTSVQPIFSRLSMLISCLVATQSLGPAYKADHRVEETELGFNTTHKVFFIAFCVLAFLGFIIILRFTENHPPRIPPSEPENSLQENETAWRPPQELRELWSVLKNPKFIILIIVGFMIQAPATLNVAIFTSVVIATFPWADDQYVGVFISVAQVMGMIGSTVAWVLFTTNLKPKLLFMSGITLTTVFYFVLFFSLRFQNIPGVFAAYILVIMSRDYIRACHYQRLVAAMHSESKSTKRKALILCGTLPFISSPLTGYMGRTAMKRLGPAFAFLSPIPLTILPGIILCGFWNFLTDNEK